MHGLGIVTIWITPVQKIDYVGMCFVNVML